MSQFPSLRAQQLFRVLAKEPLCYEVDRSKGSHLVLTSPNGYKRLLFAFHDRETVAPGLVKNILVKQVGLSEEEALELL